MSRREQRAISWLQRNHVEQARNPITRVDNTPPAERTSEEDTLVTPSRSSVRIAFARIGRFTAITANADTSLRHMQDALFATPRVKLIGSRFCSSLIDRFGVTVVDEGLEKLSCREEIPFGVDRVVTYTNKSRGSTFIALLPDSLTLEAIRGDALAIAETFSLQSAPLTSSLVVAKLATSQMGIVSTLEQNLNTYLAHTPSGEVPLILSSPQVI